MRSLQIRKQIVIFVIFYAVFTINLPSVNARPDSSQGENIALSKMVVTIDDVIKSKTTFELSAYTQKYDTNEFTERDLTSELKDYCAIDCVKKLWYVPIREYVPKGYRRLTIIIIRMSSVEIAEKANRGLYEQLKNSSNEFYEPANIRASLPATSWSYYNGNYYLGSTYGEVLLLFIQKMRGFFDIDDPAEFALLGALAEVQINKLESFEPIDE